MLSRLGFPPIGRHGRFVAAIAVDAVGSGVFMPVSVLYFLASTRLSLVEIGLALSLASATRLPLSPVLGTVVDRVGARRILLLSNLVQAAGFVSFVFADSFTSVLVASAVVQLGQTAFWGSYGPVVAVISELGERERWFGFLGALRNASFAIGGLLAALVITIGTPAAYTAVVILNAASYLLAYGLLLTVRPSSTPQVVAPAVLPGSGLPPGWGQVLRDRPYRLFILTNFTFAMSAMALNIAMPVYFTQNLHLPGWVAGAVFTLNTVMIGVGQGLAVNAMEGSVRTNIISLGSLLFVASYAVMFAADWAPEAIGVVVVLAGAIVFSGGELIAGPVLAALSTDAAPPHLLGRYTSLYQLSWTVSSTIAPISLTWLLEQGSAPLWGALAGVGLLGVAVSARLRQVMPLAAEVVPTTRPALSSTGSG